MMQQIKSFIVYANYPKSEDRECTEWMTRERIAGSTFDISWVGCVKDGYYRIRIITNDTVFLSVIKLKFTDVSIREA